MKASEGQEIVCNCPRPVGRFSSDVDDRANGSARDFEISLDGVPDDEGRWVCPICEIEVARFFGDHWRVITQR
jgi:hypothetical protein